MVLFSADLFCGKLKKINLYTDVDASKKLSSTVKPAWLDVELLQLVGLFFLLSILPQPQAGDFRGGLPPSSVSVALRVVARNCAFLYLASRKHHVHVCSVCCFTQTHGTLS